MRLNHLDLQVPDVPATAAFFERYFDFRIASNRTSSAIIILTGEEGFTLVLQRRRSDQERYPEGFHIGFIVDRDERVHAKRAELAGDGISCSEIIQNKRGLMFYVHGPGDVLIEVNCRGRATG
jgi:catechol 2,3-dioxygenase-like lactoylglutathione lyase family enzyme